MSGQLEDQRRKEVEINAQFGKVRRQKTNIADAIAEHRHSPTLLKRLEELEAQENQLKMVKAEFEAAALQPIPEIEPGLLLKILEDIKSTLDTGTHQEKQSLLRGLIKFVRVHREDDGIHGELCYFYPPDPIPKVPSGPEAVRMARRSSGPPSYTHSFYFIIKKSQ